MMLAEAVLDALYPSDDHSSWLRRMQVYIQQGREILIFLTNLRDRTDTTATGKN
jgi:hypothetical protein